MDSERLYIHETIAITVKHRQQYLAHFCTWGPLIRKYYGVHLYGVWATVGSTDVWPEAVVMWELSGLDGLTKMLSGEFAFLADADAEIAEHWQTWWSYAPEGVVDTNGFDRLLIPTPSSPGIHDLIDPFVPAVGYYHETVTTPPGAATRYLEAWETGWRPVVERCGLRLLGAFRTMLRNDSEVITLWATPDWRAWAEVERTLRGDEGERWRQEQSAAGVDWRAKLLTAAPDSPLATGTAL